MEKIRDFRDLIVWQEAHRMFLALADDVEAFPANSLNHWRLISSAEGCRPDE